MKILPLPGKLLLKLSSDHEVSAGGIILAKSIKKMPPEKGVAIAIGPPGYDEKHKQRAQAVAKVGDTVYFKKGFGVKWYVPGQPKRMFLDEKDVIGVEDENTE